MSGVKLTEKQRTVLHILSRVHRDRDVALSGPDIGEQVFRHQRVKRGAREWASPALRSLEKRGLVERLGTTFTNAQCWAITPAGRLALSTKTEGAE